MGMTRKIIFSQKCLAYGSRHIESPDRIQKAYAILKREGYEFLEPEPATEKALLRVHDSEYVRMVREGLIADADTPAYTKIDELASLSAGAAILAAKVNGFSLMRPPGHHAGKHGVALGVSTRGFCYFNNLAVAIKSLKVPTLILDIDGHHGNGTQEIFLGDETVTFVSLHRYPHYPGTGYVSEANCYNFPLWADCGDDAYLDTLDEALRFVVKEKFEKIAVSAGFDTHRGDLASLGLTGRGYWEIGKRIAKLNKPTFFVLEGGYQGTPMGKDIAQLLKGFEA